MPPGATPYPEGTRYHHQQGEAMVGVFKLKAGGEALAFANTNSLAWQGIVVQLKQSEENPLIVGELVDKETRWEEFGPWGDINFPLKPAGVTVVRLVPRK